MESAEGEILPPLEEVDAATKPQHHRSSSFLGRRRGGSRLLVQPHEIAVYIQKPTFQFQFDDVKYFLTNVELVEPARFNFPKPPALRLSDDAWAALQLRVDHAARNILDPHRYYAAASGVALLIAIVFYSIRPGYDRRRIHAPATDDAAGGLDDDEMYDDYLQDDLWERNHRADDVVEAELEYLNAALDKSLWVWRAGLAISLSVLFGAVIFIAVLMERRNVAIDEHIRRAVEEIRPRMEDEGIAVDYRTRSSQPTARLFFLGKYMRPTRVVVFRYLDESETPRSQGSDGGGPSRAKKTSSFFSEDYQRRYFPPRSTEADDRSAVASWEHSII